MGTEFKPIKFSLDEPCDSMALCGCKLSKNAPFCDKGTCKELADGTFTAAGDLQMNNEAEEEEFDIEIEHTDDSSHNKQ